MTQSRHELLHCKCPLLAQSGQFKPAIAAGTDLAKTHNAAAANNKIRLIFDLII
jgi:hypothetical protein